ncbi:MAG TPA: hypothetical protein VJZ71_13905 [Phycisphaerae bacterium]|nr:hypothetical protein [Phycisphaerae bacterium]
MIRIAFSLAILAVMGGCTTWHRYEVDLSRLKDFDWDGKIIVKNRDHGFFAGWKTEEVAVQSRDGRIVELDTRHRGRPDVTLVGDPSVHKADVVIIRKESNNIFEVLPEKARRIKYIKRAGT